MCSWLEIDGSQPLLLERGSLVLVPHGFGHSLVDERGRACVEFFDLPIERVTERYELLRYGGGGDDIAQVYDSMGNDRFGVMAGDVFNAWGVRETLDFGRIVFHLVEAGLLRKREEDSLTDFIDKFDFQDAFALKVREGRG